MLIRGHFWPVFLDKTVVFIHSHTVGIGQNIQVSAVAAGMLSDIHGGGDLKHGDLILFTGINGSCELRITEHIHDTVITDPVTASEVLMGIVVEHTPAEASGDILLPRYGIQYVGMADRMFTAAFLIIEGFCGIHVSVVFADQVRLVGIGSNLFLRVTAGSLAVVQKIVISIDVLQQMAFLNSPDTAGRSRGIQLMCHGIGLFVKRIIIRGFIDPYTPQNNRRMIAVLTDHVLCIDHRLCFPGVISNMLPAGKLCEDQKSQFVAPLQKIMTLGIVGSPHGIQPQLFF